MAIVKELGTRRVFMGKLAHGADLLEEITTICVDNNIKLGRIEGLGAVKKSCLGFYSQDTKEYQYLTLDKNMEISNLVGNVSLKDGVPIVHAHITLSDEQGCAYGGHLAPDTIIFACEILVHELDGPEFRRGTDQVTGLPLWELQK